MSHSEFLENDAVFVAQRKAEISSKPRGSKMRLSDAQSIEDVDFAQLKIALSGLKEVNFLTLEQILVSLKDEYVLAILKTYRMCCDETSESQQIAQQAKKALKDIAECWSKITDSFEIIDRLENEAQDEELKKLLGAIDRYEPCDAQTHIDNIDNFTKEGRS